MVDAERGVPVVLNDLVAHFANLQLCGSVWACPVCGPRVREVRAEEIERGVATHMGGGGGAGFLTLTARHRDGQELARLLETISFGFRSVLGSRGWRIDREEFAIAGTIRSAEVTHGPNGWHPHLHVLVLTERPLPLSSWEVVGDRFYPRWCNVLVRAGYGRPTRSHGVHLSAVRSASDVAAYTAKIEDGAIARPVGRELTRHDTKQARRTEHRTPFTILRDFAETGDVHDRDLWREYETATKGKRSLQWSRGLKLRLLVGERTDEEIAAEDVGGEVLDVLSRPEWGYVRSKQIEAFLLGIAEGERPTFDQLMYVIREAVAREANG
jgi:hypothetical protein